MTLAPLLIRSEICKKINMIESIFNKTRIFEITNTRVMTTKLTLTIEKAIIEQAKEYALQSGTSLSKLTENFFKSLTQTPNIQSMEHPVWQLKGSIPATAIENIQQDYATFLLDKYSK